MTFASAAKGRWFESSRAETAGRARCHDPQETLPPLPPGLCPEKQISSGKILYARTRPVRNRVALALRLGANSLHQADNYLGHFFRRMKARIGKPQAVAATAHKLARIIFHLLANKKEYTGQYLPQCRERNVYPDDS